MIIINRLLFVQTFLCIHKEGRRFGTKNDLGVLIARNNNAHEKEKDGNTDDDAERDEENDDDDDNDSISNSNDEGYDKEYADNDGNTYERDEE